MDQSTGRKEKGRIPSQGGSIIVECPVCGKILFKGTRQQAKGLIIYCTDC